MPKSHLQDDALFGINWNLNFIHESTHTKWISHKSKNRRLAFEVGITTNLIYFGITLIMRLCLSSEYYMDGIIYMSINFAFCLGCFLLICGSRRKNKLRKTILKIVDQNHMFVLAIFYPILLLRCCGYLHFFYINCYVEEVESLSFQWEAVSFWCYVFVWKGFPLIIAGLPFSLALPSFILSCFCSLFTALLLKTALGFMQSTIQFALSLAFLSLYYLILRREMSEFAWKLRYERSAKREQQISEDMAIQEAENTARQVQQKSMIFGELAHDIGTPLAALSMSIDLLHSAQEQPKAEESSDASNGNLSHEQAESFEMIRASITMIQAIRESILNLAKKAHGFILKPSYEEVQIETIISKKIFPVLKSLLGYKKESIIPSWYVDPNLANTQVLSCESWLNDMLLNFVSNAVKFTSMGTIVVGAKLELCSKTGVEMILFEVKDTGRGVLKEEEDMLFRSFSQCQHDKGGTGLGIMSVRRKAKIMGGDAGYKPNAIRGSIFYFTIPHFKMGQLYKGHPQNRKRYTSPRIHAAKSLEYECRAKSIRYQLIQKGPKLKSSNRCQGHAGKIDVLHRPFSEPRRTFHSNSSNSSSQISITFQKMLKTKGANPRVQIEDFLQVDLQGEEFQPQGQTTQKAEHHLHHSEKPYKIQPPLYGRSRRSSCQSSLDSIKECRPDTRFCGLQLSSSQSQSKSRLSSLSIPRDRSRTTSPSGFAGPRKLFLHSKSPLPHGTDKSGRPSEKLCSSGRYISYLPDQRTLTAGSSLQATLDDWKLSHDTCDDSGQIDVASFSERKSDDVSNPLQPESSRSSINRYSGEYFPVRDVAALVVDDSELILSLYTRLLKKCNVTCVKTARSGEECLDYFFGMDSNQGFDLLLIDDQMSGLRGPEIARLISSRVQHPPKIYLCTGNNAQAIQEEFPDSDRFLSGIVSKPVPFEMIKEMIRTVKQCDKKML